MNLAQPEQASREKLELALRNCLAMATRMQRRARHPADKTTGSDPWGDIVRFCAEAGVTSNILREASPDSSVSALIMRRNFPVPVTFAALRVAQQAVRLIGAIDEVYAVVDGREVRVAVVRENGVEADCSVTAFGWGYDFRALLEVADEQGYWGRPHEVRLDLVKREIDHA